MLRVAIVEDDPVCRSQIEKMLRRYEQEHQTPISIAALTDGSELVAGYRAEYDILLLDIEMPNLNGMKAAQRIRQMDEYVVIVFITNMAQYAIKGYEVDALDFILKPLNYYTFSMRFTRAVGRVKRRAEGQIVLALAEGVKKLDVRQVYYVEIQDRLLHYHTMEGEYVVRGTLKTAQQELEPWNFAKCNHWYLVNLRHVSEIRNHLVVVAGHELEISRRNRTAFLAAVMSYMGEST